MRAKYIKLFCYTMVPYAVAGGIWAGFTGHRLIASFCIAYAIVVIMDIANSGD